MPRRIQHSVDVRWLLAITRAYSAELRSPAIPHSARWGEVLGGFGGKRVTATGWRRKDVAHGRSCEGGLGRSKGPSCFAAVQPTLMFEEIAVLEEVA